MTISLKTLMQENLAKAKKVDKEPVDSRLKKIFETEHDESITDEECQNVIDEGVPYLDEADPNYHHHVKRLAKIKRDNPTLYAKMKAWE